jgi:biopolymer transport protein ExbB
MLELLKSGGMVMIPIALCAVFATFIIFERLYYFFTISAQERALKADIPVLVNKRDYAGAKKYCEAASGPVSQVTHKILDNRTMTEGSIKELAEVEICAVVPQLEHFLTPLGTIANVSTLLGLLGTVAGNIQAFGVLGSGGAMGNPSQLAGAIAESLITTAAGLIVSIPSVIFYNYFVSRVKRQITEIESFASAVIFNITRGI